MITAGTSFGTAIENADAPHPDPIELTLEPPDTWAGYRRRPHTLVFWRGDPDGPRTRHPYTRGADGWACRVIPG